MIRYALYGGQVRALAQAINPAATGFKLNDAELTLVAKHGSAGRGGGGKRQQQGQEEDAGGAAVAAAAKGGAESTLTSGISGSEAVVGPPVSCACETDIFTAVGLSYVPPHMRDI